MGITLGFDVGKASLGVCARTDCEILVLESHIIPSNYGTTDDLQKRRHMFRTRMAHQQRERWFMEAIWLKAGLPDYRTPKDGSQFSPEWDKVIASLPGYDWERHGKRIWSREFPKKGDNTVFNSALLRIMLIEGEKLEDWQIFKALWSAIQKRGAYYYDWKSVPPDLESVEGNAANLVFEKLKLEAEVERLNSVKLAAKAKSTEKDELTEQWTAAKGKLKAWKDEFQDELDAIGNYQDRLVETVRLEKYFFPCYLEAARMGLWVYDDQTCQGQIKAKRIDYTADTLFRGKVKKRAIEDDPTSEKDVTINESNVPRAFRLKELRALWIQAQKQLPALQAFTFEYFLYGDSQAPFATVGYNDTLRQYKRFRGLGPNYLALRKGHNTPQAKQTIDTQGVHGQKVPRFDNRIIAKCQLFKTRNVCKANSIENKQYSLLVQLKNLRFISHTETSQLKPDELKAVYNAVHTDLFDDKKTNELAKRRLHEVLKTHVPDYVSLLHYDGKDKIKLNTEGRARFSRPALKLLNHILLEGLNPTEDVEIEVWAEANKITLSNDPNKGITHEEVANALPRLGKSWVLFQVEDDRQGTFALAQQIRDDADEKRQAVMQLIGTCNNPVVRHRLTFFYNQLVKLETQLADKGYNLTEDGKVNIEFVRGADSGFDGKKTADDFTKAIKEGEKKNEDAIKELIEAHITPHRVNIQKLRLLKEQLGCIYAPTKTRIELSELPFYDIDHIVPISRTMSCDAMWNKVLVPADINRVTKQNRTPYEFIIQTQGEAGWAAHVQKMKSMSGLSPKKLALLTSKDPEKLIERYNGLAETSYIARLAQQIVALQFAWPLQVADENRRIFVNSGKETELIRGKYKLYRALLTEAECVELDDLQDQIEQLLALPREQRDEGIQKAIQDYKAKIKTLLKKRSNPTHHALDAFCVTLSHCVRFYKREEGDNSPSWIIRLHPEQVGSQAYRQLAANNQDEFQIFHQQIIDQLKACSPTYAFEDKKGYYPKETSYGMVTLTKKGLPPHKGEQILAARTLEGSLVAYLQKKDAKNILDPKLRQAVINELALDKKGFLERLNKQQNQSDIENPFIHRNSIVKNVTIKCHISKGSLKILRFKGSQYRVFEETTDRIIFKNTSGKWVASQLYPYHSIKNEKEILIKQRVELYENGMSFKNGTLIQTMLAIAEVGEVDKSNGNLKSEKVTLEQGLYRLAKADESLNKIVIENSEGVRFQMSFKKLLEAEPKYPNHQQAVLV